jgi:CsoR family transcriptional regulator, copper-sensing transcriptional repressor
MNTKKAVAPDHKKMLDRLSRAEGQIRALRHSLESGELDCKEFITQVKAARSALRAVSEQYVLEHLGRCQKMPSSRRDKEIAEAIHLFADQ